MNAVRTAVSKKKHRYKADGYNLDLTYITDRLIAMGYPAEKVGQNQAYLDVEVPFPGQWASVFQCWAELGRNRS